MTTIYPLLATILSFISSKLPFSLFDGLTIAAVLALLTSIVRLIIRKTTFKRWLYHIVMSAIWIALWFYLSWGIGYFRPDFYQRFNLSKPDAGSINIGELTRSSIDSLNKYYVSTDVFNEVDISHAIENGYAQQHTQLLLPYPCGVRRTKQSIYQPIQTKMGVSGFFGPFFNEVHVNSYLLPPSYPFTLAHEKAHQLGVASEAECNLCAVLICTSSSNPQVRYSGYYELVSYLLFDLRKSVPESYKDIYLTIDEKIRKDYEHERQHWLKGLSPRLSEMHRKVYDSYLKSNRVDSGIKSYSEVVELLAAWLQNK